MLELRASLSLCWFLRLIINKSFSLSKIKNNMEDDEICKKCGGVMIDGECEDCEEEEDEE